MLSVQIGQNHAITLIRESPKVGVDPLVSLEADLRKVVQRNKKRTRLAAWFAPVFYSLSSPRYHPEPEGMLIASPVYYVSLGCHPAECPALALRSDARERKLCNPILQSVIELEDVRAVGLLVDTLKMTTGISISIRWMP